MRIDRFLSNMGVCTRTEAARAARAGNIAVNGKAVRDVSAHIDPEKDEVVFSGRRVGYEKYTYVMLNKPDGYLSSTDDGSGPTVVDLLPDELRRRGLFPCGRLDKDTLGLIVLMNNGALAHELLSPSKHVEKTYLFECASPLSETDVETLTHGVDIGEKSSTLPATVVLESPSRGHITVCEGKFHQIKRMFAAVSNKITYLERVSFGGIKLDAALGRGKWRYLTKDEIASLEKRN